MEFQKAKTFLKWARAHAKLKVVSAHVPAQILPQGIFAQLHDIKVFVRHGPDDSLYDENKEIRDRVARGNCILELDNCKEAGFQCVTYALKKFTGGLGDDDDRNEGDNHTWKRYFIKPLSEGTHVICTSKANGEAAHMSAVKIQEEIYIVAGSKNVHMLFRTKEDIAKYEEDRFRIAREVAAAIIDLFENITSQQKSDLLEYLCSENVTAIFEILNPEHQHVENLSHLEKPELHFITWTSNDVDPGGSEKTSLCHMSPDKAIDIARSFGLSTVTYERIAVRDVEARMREIRTGYGYEGEVLYFMDEHDQVIGLLKKKTIWYIISRAIREKIRNALKANSKNSSTFNPTKSQKQITSRLKEIQLWLKLDDLAVAKWTDLGCAFLVWIIDKSNSRPDSADSVVEMFPIHWRKFLEESGKSDKIDVQWEETDDPDD